MTQKLYIRFEESLVGTVEADVDGTMIFSYDAAWLAKVDAFPLSVALNLNTGIYRGQIVESFFENLIPEGIQRRQLEVLADLPEGDDISFLQRFGEDCAGALTISLQPELVSSVNRRGSAEANVSFAAIERALNDGMPVQSVLRTGEDLPPFSLAGAQAKFPCIIRDHSILMPRSGEPTTHIVKLPIRAGSKWLDSVPNEFICMRLAAAVGLQVPNVMIIGAKIPLFAIERFDRKLSKAGPKRLHTQDFCQALGLPSSRKYEEHGGPSFADCFHLLAEESSNIARDQLALLDWLAINLAIGNNDGHAKNLSLILGDGRIGLAPFYDIVCTAIYKQYSTQFAFKIGESRNWQKIRSSSIDTLARQMQVTPTLISSRWLEIFDKLENAVADLKAPQHFEKSISKTLAKVAKEVRMRLAELRKNITQRKT